MEKAGVKVLAFTQDATPAFATKFPLKKMADFKGKRVRASNQMQTFIIRDLGAAPAFMGGGEVYMALQRGTVDGATSSVTSFRDRKYFEVTKYVTGIGYNYGLYGVLLTLTKWNGMPADLQKMLLGAGEDTQKWHREEVLKMSKEAVEDLAKNGMEIYTLPKEEWELWKKATLPSAQKIFLGKMGEAGQRLIKMAEDAR